MSRHATLFGLDISYLAPHATQEMKALLSFCDAVSRIFNFNIRITNMSKKQIQNERIEKNVNCNQLLTP